MAASAFLNEERLGLGVALLLHVAVGALLIYSPEKKSDPITESRITVTISDDVGLISTAPNPALETAADEAPELGSGEPDAGGSPADETPVGPVPKPLPVPVTQPKPVPQVAPSPVPRPSPTARPNPKPIARPTSRPTPAPRATATAAPKPKPSASASSAARTPAANNRSQASNAATARGGSNATANTRAGSSRLGSDFLAGAPGGRSTSPSAGQAAATVGPAVRNALSGAISRKLKPHWSVPQGADTEQLVTILSWNLNRDGSLAGRPQVVRQEGITDANRSQAARHAEQAMRAVQLAAPFNLPAEHYDAWKRVSSFRFDRRLSQ